MAEDLTSLMSLEDELTCSICLSPFECPVTIPCGHNFCQDCLLATWTDTYSCPQCQTPFLAMPELKKNTVLSTVVQTFILSSPKSDPAVTMEKETINIEEPEPQSVVCDTCMEAEAVKTCLTCMASYCEEHVRPHRENPIFGAHQLNDPLRDLHERICSDHHKLMEFYCVTHCRCICSFCLQQVHKECEFSTPDEQRALQESDMRNKLDQLDGKIEKNQTVISEMKNLQNKLKDSASSRKKVLEGEYRQIREMLDREEREALNMVDCEQESGQTKLQALMKKFDQNIDKLTGARDDIKNLLSQSQSLAFLQASVDLPSQAAFNPYTPRVNLDSTVVVTSQAFAAVLKEHLFHIFNQPVEARSQILKSESSGDCALAPCSEEPPLMHMQDSRGGGTSVPHTDEPPPMAKQCERFVPPLIPNPPPMLVEYKGWKGPTHGYNWGPAVGGVGGHPQKPWSHSHGAGQSKKPPQQKSDKKTDQKDHRESEKKDQKDKKGDSKSDKKTDQKDHRGATGGPPRNPRSHSPGAALREGQKKKPPQQKSEKKDQKDKKGDSRGTGGPPRNPRSHNPGAAPQEGQKKKPPQQKSDKKTDQKAPVKKK